MRAHHDPPSSLIILLPPPLACAREIEHKKHVPGSVVVVDVCLLCFCFGDGV